MERAQRRILVQYPKRQQGNRMFGGESSHLPLKLNTSGVIPPIFASSLLLLPATVGGFARHGRPGLAVIAITPHLGYGQPLHIALYVALIVFFCFFYTSIVFNPKETAENLRKYGGFIPGFRPGKSTADYLDYVLTRLTVGRRPLSGGGLRPARDPDLAVRGAVLLRRHQPADRRLRDDGHGGADPVASDRASI